MPRAQQHTLHQHEMISARRLPPCVDVASAASGENQRAQLVCRCFGSLIQGSRQALRKLSANMKRHSALLKAQLSWAQGKEALYGLHNGYSIALKKNKTKQENKWQPQAEKLKEEKAHFCKSI